MNMLTYKRAISTAAFALLSTSWFATPLSVKASDMADSEQVSQLLSQVKTDAFQLKEDSATLDTYTSANRTWDVHAPILNQMKDHINNAGRELTRMQELRNDASPWQQTAIDRISPMLRELASNTQRVIALLNQHPKITSAGEYRNYVEANSDLASQLSDMISDFVNYGKTKQRFEKLGSKLEIS